MAEMDPQAKLSLSKAHVLVMENNQHAADMLGQILKGFGVGEVHRCTTAADCEKILTSRTIDLIIADPKLRDGDALDVLYDLRHASDKTARYVPIIILSGHSTASQVRRSRDIGANFYVAKPVAPNVLLQRILWVAKDKRPFVEVSKYIGPDRRFKFEGPPPGEDGRRDADLKDPIGNSSGPNLSQDEISSFLKPQKVSL
jgi:DNA-binding response OmpR family regulator